MIVIIIVIIIIKLNPWHYSSEEPRPTEVVAARWQYRGPCGQQSAYPSTLICFLNRILLFIISSSYPIALMRLGRPRSRPYTSIKISRVKPGIEPGTSWMAVRRANHYTKQAVNVHITYQQDPDVYDLKIMFSKNFFNFEFKLQYLGGGYS